MAEILLSGVKKSFGALQVIQGVDVDVTDGELIVIVGPSGCGKSTLLRMVAGLETITDGEIQINGVRVNEKEPMDRNIAMVFQNYALYPHMTVFDNMAYGLKIARRPKDEIAQRVSEAASLLQLDGLLDRKPRQLSGGQRQRVAMGRAIVRKPDAFLFDEPLSNLDAKLRVQMRIEIKRLQRRLATTSLYVTHDQVEAMTLADRLIVMNAGVAEQIGTPLEVYERPASLFVAGFIGSPAMNFLKGRLADDGTAVTLNGGTVLPLSGAASRQGAEVVVGLRPEHLRKPESGEAAVHLTVELVEPLGSDTLVHGHLPASRESITVRMPETQIFEPGSDLTVAIAADNIHLFDPQTNARI